jgi:hypothetical protein
VDDITSLKVTALPDYDSTGMGMGTDGVSTSITAASGVRGDCYKAAGVTAVIADSSALSVAAADVVTMVPPGKIIHIYRKNGKISYFNMCCVVLCCLCCVVLCCVVCVVLRCTATGCLSWVFVLCHSLSPVFFSFTAISHSSTFSSPYYSQVNSPHQKSPANTPH